MYVGFVQGEIEEHKSVWSGEIPDNEVQMLLSCDRVSLPWSTKSENESKRPFKMIEKIFEMENLDGKSVTIIVIPA